MKLTVSAAALAVLAGSAAAQNSQLSDPFYLRLSAPGNTSIDGRLLTACHTGAATSTLCVGEREPNTRNTYASLFHLNTTTAPDQGALINMYPLAGGVQIIPEPFRLVLSHSSNVLTTWFSPETFTDGIHQSVKFVDRDLVLPIYPDDSKFREGVTPQPEGRDASNWYTCYVYAGSYYYNALAWVTGGIPNNPTCHPVKVVREDVKA